MVTSSPSLRSLSLPSLSPSFTLPSSVRTNSIVLPSLSVTVNSFLSAVMLLILPFTSSASTGVASATNRIMASAIKNHFGRRIMVSPSIEETQSPLSLTTRDRSTQTTIESPREPRERVFLLFSYLQNPDRNSHLGSRAQESKTPDGGKRRHPIYELHEANM